jgi:hypothetical protein
MGMKFTAATISGTGYSNSHEYDGYPITPNDTLTTYQAQVPQLNGNVQRGDALYVTGAGNIAIKLNSAGDTASLTESANTLVPIAAHQILATGTTATGLYMLFRL